MKWSKLLYDFRFWLILTVLIKLYGIWNPPLEAWHTWRQVNVLMVANNFFEIPNLLYPKIDSNGPYSGITGMEFPLFNYCIYLCNRFFGESYMYGRLINLIISTCGLLFFYKLCKKLVSEKQALLALVLLSFSEWFMFSRKIMPDTLSISLVIISFYFAYKFLKIKGHFLSLFLYFIFALLGGLIKLPALIILSPLTYWFFTDSGVDNKNRLLFLVSSTLVLVPIIWWYFYWFPYLNHTYELDYYFMGNSFSHGLYEIITHFHFVLLRFSKSAMGVSGFIILMLGVYVFFKSKNQFYKRTFLITFLVSLVFIVKSGFAFHHHDYYILPLIPFLAFLASFSHSFISKKWFLPLIALFVIEGLLTQMRDLSVKRTHKDYLSYYQNWKALGLEDTSKVVLNNGKNPTKLFFLKQQGWILQNDSIFHSPSDTLEYSIRNGAKYAVVFEDVDPNAERFTKLGFDQIAKTRDYYVFELDSNKLKRPNTPYKITPIKEKQFELFPFILGLFK